MTIKRKCQSIEKSYLLLIILNMNLEKIIKIKILIKNYLEIILEII